jgi:hypothetical protein
MGWEMHSCNNSDCIPISKDFDLLEMKLNIVITINGPRSCLRKLAGGIIGRQVLSVKMTQVMLLNVEG